MYNCTVSSSTRMDVDVQWRVAMTIAPPVFYLYDLPLNDDSFGEFTTTASILPPNYTLTSTATLRGAQFSHNNYVLECFSQVQTPGLSGSAVLQGICKNKNINKYIYIYTLRLLKNCTCLTTLVLLGNIFWKQLF